MIARIEEFLNSSMDFTTTEVIYFFLRLKREPNIRRSKESVSVD